MTFWDLFQWWNLIFSLPFGIGVLPLLFQAIGAAHLGQGHLHLGHHDLHLGDHHLHLGHGHDIAHGGHMPTHALPAHGHDTALSAHHAAPHAGHDAGTNAHAHPHAEDGQGFFSRLFGFMGIGKVPIMLVFSIFMLIWGGTGLVANQIFAPVLKLPALYAWPSMLCAGIISYFSTSAVAGLINRLMPQYESYGTSEELLVGRVAEASYALDGRPGSAFLLDDNNNRVLVRCKTHDGSVIPRGEKVLLLEYDPTSRVYTVTRFQPELPSNSQPQLEPKN